MPEIDKSALLTPKQVGDRVGLSQITIRRMIAKKQISCYRLGWQYFISEDQFKEWITNSIQPAEKKDAA
jgi:excisionase family DNA binding protein